MVRHRRRAPIVSASLLGLALVMAACGGDDDADDAGTTTTEADAEANEELDALLAEAEAEGVQLDLVWNFQPTSLYDDLEQGFEEMYDLDLQITNTPIANIAEAAQQVLQTSDADRVSPADLFLGTEVHALQFNQNDVAQVIDWGWAENVQAHPENIQADGAQVTLLHYVPGILYNTDVIPEEDVPQTLEEILDLPDEYAIAVPVPPVNLDALAAEPLWGAERTLDWARSLAEIGDGAMVCVQLDRISSGEFALFPFDCGSGLADEQIAEGAPLGHVIPTDATIVRGLYMTVPEHAGHPATAQLMVNYLLSEAGQEQIYETQGEDNRYVDGSHTAELIAEVEAGDDDVEFVDIDVAFAAENEFAYNDTRPEIMRIFLEATG